MGLKRGEDIMQLGKDEYVYKTKGMNIFFGIKDKQMYATNDELLYKNVGKAADKSIKDAPYASDMKGKTIFVAINAEAILDLPVVKMVAGFGGQEVKTYIELANKVSYLSMSSEGEISEIDLCLKDKDVNALKQIVDFAGAGSCFNQIHFFFPEDQILVPYIRSHRITVSKHLGKCLL